MSGRERIECVLLSKYVLCASYMRDSGGYNISVPSLCGADVGRGAMPVSGYMCSLLPVLCTGQMCGNGCM